MRYWSETNPQKLHERPLHSARVTVWCGISASRIIGPYFLEENHGNTITVTLERYAKLLTNFLIPELHCFGVDLTRAYFQLDEATAHTARETLSTLCTLFADRIISRYGDIPWPARSPDLPACDFFFWGYLKSRVFATRIPYLQTMETRIQEEVEAILHRMLASVMDNFVCRLRECIPQNDGYLSGLTLKE
jgi:hypothetical protein